MRKLLFILMFVLSGHQCLAEPLGLLRRWAVFPFDTEPDLVHAAQDAWWKGREVITAKKKYLVASRQFLEQKDAFQSRKELKSEDCIVLGQILDAEILVTGFTKGRTFTLNAYLSKQGLLFWSKTVNFHPSLKLSEQLESLSEVMFKDLLKAMPYDGFTITDPLIGKVTYESDSKKLSIVDFGRLETLEIGTDVQWVQIELPDQPGKTPALTRSQLTVVAEGKVTSFRQGIATVELLRIDPKYTIVEGSQVRISKPVSKDALPEGEAENPSERLAPELLPSTVGPIPDNTNEKKAPFFLTASSLGLIGLILLAL